MTEMDEQQERGLHVGERPHRQGDAEEVLRVVDADTRFRAMTQLLPRLGDRPATRGTQGPDSAASAATMLRQISLPLCSGDTCAFARGCRVITVSSGAFKTIPGWLRISLVVIVISRF